MTINKLIKQYLFIYKKKHKETTCLIIKLLITRLINTVEFHFHTTYIKNK